jgi:hypothetical protein
MTEAALTIPTWPMGVRVLLHQEREDRKALAVYSPKGEDWGHRRAAALARERWHEAVHELCLTKELLRHLGTGGDGR